VRGDAAMSYTGAVGSVPDTRARVRAAAATVLLLAATIAVHARSLDGDYVSLDDFQYVRDNVHVQRGLTPESIAWAFQLEQAHYISYFHPLTWLSLMLDTTVFGPGPRGHHLVNVLLHATSAALLLLFLVRTTRSLGPSLVASLLFAVHPLNVESVAWIT
jgi:hypothetical protein